MCKSDKVIPSGVKYEFEAQAWKYDGPAAWIFVSLPLELSLEIRDLYKHQEEGWGRLQVYASISNITWKTAIWYDKKKNLYLLPLKKDIRLALAIKIDTTYQISIWI